MASIFFGEYFIDYSIVTGKILEFSKNVSGEDVSVTNPNEMSHVVKRLMQAQDKQGRGDSATLLRLEKEGIKISDAPIENVWIDAGRRTLSAKDVMYGVFSKIIEGLGNQLTWEQVRAKNNYELFIKEVNRIH